MASIHEGHRARMRARLRAEGLEGFSAHEAMELLLYYPLPLRDVNPLAHALVDRFGSLSGVLRADPAETARVPGVGAGTAAWLAELGALVAYYQTLTLADRPRVDTMRVVCRFGTAMLAGAPEGTVGVLLTSVSDYLLGVATLSGERRVGEGAFLREVVTLAVRYHAKQVILVRTRKNARGKHTAKDIRRAERLREILGRMEVFLKDDLLLGGQDVSSLRAAHVLNETDDSFAAMRARTEESWFV